MESLIDILTFKAGVKDWSPPSGSESSYKNIASSIAAVVALKQCIYFFYLISLKVIIYFYPYSSSAQN